MCSLKIVDFGLGYSDSGFYLFSLVITEHRFIICSLEYSSLANLPLYNQTERK